MSWWEPKLPPQAIGIALTPARPHLGLTPKTMINLTFTAHQHRPTELCPTLVLCKPGRWMYFQHFADSLKTLVSSLPGAGLTEINSFPVLPPIAPLPLAV